MKYLVALLLALVLPAMAAAETGWPALYDVVGVAGDDVLNVRAGPGADFDKLGSLPTDATGIEVVAVNDTGNWGLVNLDERSGWVSLTYMRRLSGQEEGAFPALAQCYGTEPFWDLERDGTSVTVRLLTDVIAGPVAVQQTRSSGRLDRFGLAGEGIAATIARSACNDGMSDRQFGLSVELLLRSGSDWAQYSGCCSLRR